MAPSRLFTFVSLVVLGVTVSACASTSNGIGSTQPVATTSSSSAPIIGGSPSASTPAASASASPAATESNPPGDIPDNQAFVTFTSVTGNYSVKVPEGWARTATGTTVAFTDKLNSITVLSSATPSAPTVASVTAADVASRRASVPQFALGKVSAFTRDGGSGVLLTYLADSAPDPVTNKVVRDAVQEYFFWKSGQLTILRLTGAQNADNVDPWAKVTGSYRWTK